MEGKSDNNNFSQHPAKSTNFSLSQYQFQYGTINSVAHLLPNIGGSIPMPKTGRACVCIFDHENRAAVTQCHGNQVTKITPAAWLMGTPALDFADAVCSSQVVSLAPSHRQPSLEHL